MADTHRLKAEKRGCRPDRKSSGGRSAANGRGIRLGFLPVGVVHSPFKKPSDIPREMNVRRDGFKGVKGVLEIFPAFARGLKDLGEYPHIIVIFAFHEASESKLLVRPPLQSRLRGVFATRSPHRPNPIGMTIVRLESRKGCRLNVSGVDMVEGTPILDIKPYTSRDRKGTPRGARSSGRLRP
jgi:tRNA-Thr(GGU) m(6)t(6)A37 methyltransferase TsaA